MRCWNCGKKVPDNATVCGFCEAAVEEFPTVVTRRLQVPQVPWRQAQLRL